MDESLHEVDDSLELWTPLDGHFGSLSYSLMIRPEDFRADGLERCHTLCWQ